MCTLNLNVTPPGILRTDEGTEVAVKMYHPDIKAIDIQKEIDAMTQLKHDYIIPLKGLFVFFPSGFLANML